MMDEQPIQIRLRKPMRELPAGGSAEWQQGYRDRLLKVIIDSESYNTPETFFGYWKSSSTTCPDCFCPNLESYYSEYGNGKGVVCPACGNGFEFPIKKYVIVTDEQIAKAERERILKLLEPYEWSGSHTDYEDSWGVMTRACPFCFNAMDDGHKKDCVLESLRDLPRAPPVPSRSPCIDCPYNCYPCAKSNGKYPDICRDKEEYLIGERK
ncbi:MAG TPA: hypothetical protein PLW50_00015 [Smithellaceae bacterium]|nr:hypothetical protein [Smithellaceae bacterium]